MKRTNGKLALLSLLAILVPSWPEVIGVTLAWDANKESDLAGYNLYYGPTNSAPQKLALAKVTSIALTKLSAGKTYAFYLTAINTAGLESNPSSTITYTAPDDMIATQGTITG